MPRKQFNAACDTLAALFKEGKVNAVEIVDAVFAVDTTEILRAVSSSLLAKALEERLNEGDVDAESLEPILAEIDDNEIVRSCRIRGIGLAPTDDKKEPALHDAVQETELFRAAYDLAHSGGTVDQLNYVFMRDFNVFS